MDVLKGPLQPQLQKALIPLIRQHLKHSLPQRSSQEFKLLLLLPLVKTRSGITDV